MGTEYLCFWTPCTLRPPQDHTQPLRIFCTSFHQRGGPGAYPRGRSSLHVGEVPAAGVSRGLRCMIVVLEGERPTAPPRRYSTPHFTRGRWTASPRWALDTAREGVRWGRRAQAGQERRAGIPHDQCASSRAVPSAAEKGCDNEDKTSSGKGSRSHPGDMTYGRKV